MIPIKQQLVLQNIDIHDTPTTSKKCLQQEIQQLVDLYPPRPLQLPVEAVVVAVVVVVTVVVTPVVLPLQVEVLCPHLLTPLAQEIPQQEDLYLLLHLPLQHPVQVETVVVEVVVTLIVTPITLLPQLEVLFPRQTPIDHEIPQQEDLFLPTVVDLIMEPLVQQRLLQAACPMLSPLRVHHQSQEIR